MEAVQEISLDGFKVVGGEYFAPPLKSQSPTMTVWSASIGFSKQCLVLLNNCENILMQINAEEKKVLIIPTKSNDKDAVRWSKKTEPEPRKLSCQKLTKHLYELWSWEPELIYRSTGRLVTVSNKVMLLFDFSDAESWKTREARNVK